MRYTALKCTTPYTNSSSLLLFSDHLFLCHPTSDVGELTERRKNLVMNKHLILLAKKLELGGFVIKKMCVAFGDESSCRILSNCLEAIIGAVFLDGGMQEADELFARLAFPEVHGNLRCVETLCSLQ